MSERRPLNTARVRIAAVSDRDVDCVHPDSFDVWLDGVRAAARREGQAEGMRSTADWLEGGTPRAYGFQHPCDPPGVRWEPSGDERRLLYAVDAIREAADRIENGDRHVDQ